MKKVSLSLLLCTLLAGPAFAEGGMGNATTSGDAAPTSAMNGTSETKPLGKPMAKKRAKRTKRAEPSQTYNSNTGSTKALGIGAAGPQGSTGGINSSSGGMGTTGAMPEDSGPMDNSTGGIGGTATPNSAGPNGGVANPVTSY